MSFDRSLVTNTAKYGLATASQVFLFALFVLAARKLGPTDFGVFSFAVAFVTFFDPIIDPGFHTVIVRDIARRLDQSNHYISNILAWKLFLVVPYLLVTIGFAWLFHPSMFVLHAIFAVALAGFLKSVKESFVSVLKAHEHFGFVAISAILERLALLLFGALALLREESLINFCWTFVAVRFADLFLAAAIVQWKICPIGLSGNLSLGLSLVRKALPIGAIVLIWRFYAEIDTVMLSAMTTNEEVGWYNASYKIFEGLGILAATLSTVMQPRLARLFYENVADFNKLQAQALKWVVFCAAMVSANGWLISEWLVPKLYGPLYNNSILSLNIMLLGVIFFYCFALLQSIAIAMDHHRIILYAAVAGLIFNLILNFILISWHGYVGAALATVIADFLVLVLLLLYMKAYANYIPSWPIFGKCILVVILCFGIAKYFIYDYSIILTIVLMNGFILGLLYLSKFLTKKEMESLINILRPGRRTYS